MLKKLKANAHHGSIQVGDDAIPRCGARQESPDGTYEK
jgi:hypothetical protein